MKVMKKNIGIVAVTSLAMTPSINPVQSDDVQSYFLANYNQFRGNKKQASQWYQSMLANSAPAQAYLGYLYHLDEIGNYAKIVELYPHIKDRAQDDPKLQLLYALALAQTGRKKDSDETLVQLQTKFKGDKEIAFYATNRYLQAKEPENALSVINDFLQSAPRRPQNFVFYFMKSQVYAQLNKYEDALASVKQALQLHPQFDKGWLMLALLEEQAGKLQEAIEGYTSYLEFTSEPNKNIEQHLMQLALKQELAHRNKRMISLDPACFEKAAALFERKQFRQALGTVEECLKQTPEHVDLRLLKLRTLVAMDQPHDAVRAVAQWIGQRPSDELWYRTLHLLVRAQASDEITKIAIYELKRVEVKNKNELLPALYLADLSLRSHNTGDAKMYLEHAFNRTHDPKLQVKILYQRALLAHQANEQKEMGEALERAHALDPNFIPAANLLAHHVAASLHDHQRAQRLISTALEKHPHNIHLLDTQAMIYELENKHAEAKKIRDVLASSGSKCLGCDKNLLVKK